MVNNGFIDNLFPFLTDSSQAYAWGVLIGHFVGVDHVGRRVGPDYPTMLAKQQHMNDVLKRVVNAIDQNTQLFILGDHEMDRNRDHSGGGGPGVSASLWI